MITLYHAPLACSLASRISAYEADIPLEFVEVDTKTQRTQDGRDYRQVNPLGLVPTLQLDDGQLLYENIAILQHLADLAPAGGLAPRGAPGSLARARLTQWLAFVSTELHKAVFGPLLGADIADSVKEYALSLVELRFAHAARALAEREFLFDAFSVADAYLFTVLNWTQVTPIELKRWPELTRYVERLRERPSVKRALGEEIPLYARQRAARR
jgi:glutathione S-transferase